MSPSIYLGLVCHHWEKIGYNVINQFLWENQVLGEKPWYNQELWHSQSIYFRKSVLVNFKSFMFFFAKFYMIFLIVTSKNSFKLYNYYTFYVFTPTQNLFKIRYFVKYWLDSNPYGILTLQYGLGLVSTPLTVLEYNLFIVCYLVCYFFVILVSNDPLH